MNVRYRQYNPGETYFTLVDPGEIKNHNPLLNAIDAFVDEHVSLESFSQAVQNEIGGAPAAHPKMMLKIIFYSYAKGVYSSREMENRMTWDPNYICLSSNQKVDHSTICNFILKYKEEITQVFSRLVYVMAKMDYVTLDFEATDGTKIRADVSKKFTGEVAEFREQRSRIETKIEKILQHTVTERTVEKARQEKSLDRLKREKEKIQAFLDEVDQGETTVKGDVSLTDRDARMVKDKDSIYMGYNCQVAVDEKSHAIIGAEVFNTASDRGLLQPMIEEVRNRTENDLSRTEIAFDAGYFSSDNIRYCHEEKLEVYLPEGKGESGVKDRKEGMMGSRDCKLEIDGDIRRLTRPGGQVMEALEAKNRYHGNYFYCFFPNRKLCQNCGSRAKCYGDTNKHKSFTVKKEYFDTLPLRARMTEKLSGKQGKKRKTDRACVVEHVFGEIKAIFKFRRFLRRSLDKAKVEWDLVCIGYNFRKLARLAY